MAPVRRGAMKFRLAATGLALALGGCGEGIHGLRKDMGWDQSDQTQSQGYQSQSYRQQQQVVQQPLQGSPPSTVTSWQAGATSDASPIVPGQGPYVVQRGDTLYSVSRRSGVPVRTVIDANNLQPPYQLNVGQRVMLPNLATYTVAPGETLYSVSRKTHIEMSELVRANSLEPPYAVRSGQVLILPGGAPGSQPVGQPGTPVVISSAAGAGPGAAPIEQGSSLPPSSSGISAAPLAPPPGAAGSQIAGAPLGAPPSGSAPLPPPVPVAPAPSAGGGKWLPVTPAPQDPGAAPVQTQPVPPVVQAAPPVGAPSGPSSVGAQPLPPAGAPAPASSGPLAVPVPPVPVPTPSIVAAVPVPAPSAEPATPLPAPTEAPAPAPAGTQEASAAPPVLKELTSPPPRGGKSFLWPVKGRIIATFGEQAKGIHNDGINIAAARGTTVIAAENGVVAYAGNELKGFGNLLLIRHADGFMTAYAHNDELLVQRGDTVRRGQAIARIGSTGSVNEPQLHFEVRKSGQPVDPEKYLGAPGDALLSPLPGQIRRQDLG